MLKEVKDHLDVLKEMEGIIPPAEMQARKRALWAAMPPAPEAFAVAVAAGGGKRKKATSPKKLPAKAAASAADDGSEVDSVMNV